MAAHVHDGTIPVCTCGLRWDVVSTWADGSRTYASKMVRDRCVMIYGEPGPGQLVPLTQGDPLMRRPAPLELEDDVVVLDLDDFARRTAEPDLPAPRNLGGVSASPAYVQRWVDAVDDARTGRRAKTEGDR